MNSDRHWLSPKVYVTVTPFGEHRSAWPNAVSYGPWSGDRRPCVRCGTYTLDEEGEGCSFHLPDGHHCEPCRDQVAPAPKRITLRARLDVALSNLYFSYALRFGKEIQK